MQTFLPYVDFEQSAKVLDMKRLGKQRVEVLQILRTLSGETQGWKNHPAVKMWKGYEKWLIFYGLSICDEWIARGYRDTCREKILAYLEQYKDQPYPKWMGGKIHITHKSKLIQKNPEHYSPIFGDDIPLNLEYFWPSENAY